MKKLVLLYLSITISVICTGQSIAPSVNASSGDCFSQTNTNLSWTLGEMISESYSTGNITITQGFHQTKIIVNSIEENSDVHFNVKVFPNPTTSDVTVEIPYSEEKFLLELTDLNAKPLLCIYTEPFITKQIIHFDNLPPTVYYLIVNSVNKNLKKSFKITKIY